MFQVRTERWKLSGCKGKKLAGCDREITLDIVGIYFAKIRGIDVASNNYYHPNISGAGSSPPEPSHFVRPHRKRSPLLHCRGWRVFRRGLPRTLQIILAVTTMQQYVTEETLTKKRKKRPKFCVSGQIFSKNAKKRSKIALTLSQSPDCFHINT